MATKTLTRNDVLNALDLERVTQDDIIEIVDKFVEYLNQHTATVTQTVEEIRALLRQELADNTGTEFGSIKGQLNEVLGERLTDLDMRSTGILGRLEARLAVLRDGDPGKDADPELVTQEVIKRIVIPTAEDVINGLPAFPERVRDGLELLPEGDKLDIAAIEGLREELDELKKKGSNKPYLMGGGPHYLPGSGITIEGNLISSTGGGGGGVGAWSTPAEAVDGTTTVFTTTTAPTDVVADGITLFPNLGYTYAAGQITLTNAPQIYVKYR